MVVPRVGAWIETRRFRRIIPDVMVVPRVGAWIETMLPGNNTTFTMWSYPVWVRGLKLPMMSIDLSAPEVVPRVGAWIET